MSKISKALKVGVLSVFAAVVLTGSVFASSFEGCVGEGKKYPGLSTTEGNGYSIKCGAPVKEPSSDTNAYTQFYGKTAADCANVSTLASDPEICSGNDLNGIIQMIINGVIFIIGIVAVVMIILGGISYATSQGDPSKVKKGKDTILYGIIGLVIALLAYAIVNFVLGALQSN